VYKTTRMRSTCRVCKVKGHIEITVERHMAAGKAAGVYVFTREYLSHRADCRRTRQNPARFQCIKFGSSPTTRQETA
jgi:hypothetical protein